MPKTKEAEATHLVLIDAHLLQQMIRKADKRYRAGRWMMAIGGSMMIYSLLRPVRREHNDSWAAGTK